MVLQYVPNGKFSMNIEIMRDKPSLLIRGADIEHEALVGLADLLNFLVGYPYLWLTKVINIELPEGHRCDDYHTGLAYERPMLSPRQDPVTNIGKAYFLPFLK